MVNYGIKIVDEEKNDVFAIGIIILQILGFNVMKLNQDVKLLEETLMDVECRFGKKMKNFLSRMLHHDQNLRINLNELVLLIRVNL